MSKERNIDKEVGEKLRALRNARGYSQKEVELLVGIDRSYISKIEGGMIPSLKLLKDLCELYGTNVASLFGEEQELPAELKDIGVEWISLAKNMKEKDITPEQLENIVEFVKKLNLS